ncbi:MAG: TatD family nuclease-associated radical SAM protein [Elusimicrobiota bacterium]
MTVSSPRRAAPVLAYAHGDGVYLNLTNRCPTACLFCLKRLSRWSYEGKDLRLTAKEPSAAEALAAAESFLATGKYSEVIFCGYGESTYRLPAMLAVGAELSARYPEVRRRLNTVGLGNLIWGRDIVPELKRCVDAVSVSLNTADPEQWRRLHVPRPAFADKGYDAVLKFVVDCARAGIDTTVTAVRLPGVEIGAVRDLARNLGVKFRLRPLLRDTKRAGS